MTHDVPEDLLSLCTTVVRGTGLAQIGPGELAHAHRVILALPEDLERTVSCKDALDHVNEGASTILQVARLAGENEWPVPPHEVARRAVQGFKFALPWEHCLYMNGTGGPVRTQIDDACCRIAFNVNGRWGWDVAPSEKYKYGEQSGEADSVEEALLAIQGYLQHVSDETRESCTRRQAEDQRRAGKNAVQ